MKNETKVDTTALKSCCLCVSLLFLVACQPPEEKAVPEADMTKETEVTVDTPVSTEVNKMITATVKYIDLEGGFYGLETIDGQKYLPKGLDKNYLVDGTVIRFNITPIEGVMTTQQWGTLVTLSDVELIKKAVDKSEL